MSEPVADVAPNVSVVSLDSAFGFCVFCWTPRTVDEAPGAVKGLLIRLSFVLVVASALVSGMLAFILTQHDIQRLNKTLCKLLRKTMETF